MAEEKKVSKQKMQNLILENRERLNISGILEVESFNDEEIVVETELGLLVVRGHTLRINKLNIESFELYVEGDIVSLEYCESEGSNAKRTGFFSKMFK